MSLFYCCHVVSNNHCNCVRVLEARAVQPHQPLPVHQAPPKSPSPFVLPSFQQGREGQSPFLHFTAEKTSKMGLRTESSIAQYPLPLLPIRIFLLIDSSSSAVTDCGKKEHPPPASQMNENQLSLLPVTALEFLLRAWGFLLHR